MCVGMFKDVLQLSLAQGPPEINIFDNFLPSNYKSCLLGS